MRTLAIDIETYSSVSLQKCGVYAYAQSPDFEILLFGYAWDDGPVEVIDLARGENLPEELQNALYDPEILKTAFNASFERTCLSAFILKTIRTLPATIGIKARIPQAISAFGRHIKQSRLSTLRVKSERPELWSPRLWVELPSKRTSTPKNGLLLVV